MRQFHFTPKIFPNNENTVNVEADAMFFPNSLFVWYSVGVLNRLLADTLPTCCQQSADCWQKNFAKTTNDHRLTVGRLLAGSRPAVGRLSTNCRPTVVWGSCASLFPKFQYASMVQPLEVSGNKSKLDFNCEPYTPA